MLDDFVGKKMFWSEDELWLMCSDLLYNWFIIFCVIVLLGEWYVLKYCRCDEVCEGK